MFRKKQDEMKPSINLQIEAVKANDKLSDKEKDKKIRKLIKKQIKDLNKM